ncbi:MAG: hypothetical protein MJZ64_03815 [Paludibacteraceae bacterium]|nr:hypothetical protein [Paludibacteraceae bacterium]
MRITFTEPSKAEETKKHWKAIDAPCYIRATRDPKKFSIIPRKGVSAEMVNQLKRIEDAQ